MSHNMNQQDTGVKCLTTKMDIKTDTPMQGKR